MQQRKAVAALALLVAATLPVLPGTEARPAAAQTTPACSPTTTATLPLLVPAWADAAGWANASQYETIRLGDIDGDGVSELLGRNAARLEVFHWAEPYQAAAEGDPKRVADLPVPEQWVASTIPGPAMPEAPTNPATSMAPGFYEPSAYATLQLAQLTPDAGHELFVRTFDGIEIYDFVASPSGGSWQTITTSVFPDDKPNGQAWYHAQHYETITHGDVDGDGLDEILGRGLDGIETYALQGGALVRLDPSSTIMSDSDGWTDPQYYETIRVADLDGDTTAELLGRGKDGLEVYELASGTWTAKATSGPWPDSEGEWASNESWYSTIGTADLNGDGAADVYGRTKWGIDAWTFASGSWSELVTPAPSSSSPTVFTDDQGFDSSSAYETIQPATLDPTPGTPSAASLAGRFEANVLASPNTDGGLGFVSLGSGGAFSAPGLVAEQFTNANGWNQAVRYQTIQLGQLTPETTVLLGKDATGVRTQHLVGGTTSGTWQAFSADFPAWSDWQSTPPVTPTQPPDVPDELWRIQLASYQYINEQIGATFSTDLTVRQLLAQATGSNAVPLTDLATAIGKVPLPTGTNVDRDTFYDVRNASQTWALEAAALYSFYWDTQASLSQLISQTQIVADAGPNSPSDVSDSFGSSGNIDALIGDLIWGVLGAIPTDGASFEGVVAGAVNSMAGAGVSAGMGFLNPNGKVTTRADKLNAELVNAFCAANDFLGSSYAQTVADAGLLDVMGRMTRQGPLVFTADTDPPNPGQFDQIVAANDDQRAIWVWQQFANQTDDAWRVGYCWGAGQCNDGFEDRVNDGYGIFYGTNLFGVGAPGCDSSTGNTCYGYFDRVVHTDGSGTANCLGSSHKGDDAWKKLVDAGVGFDPNDLFMPRQMANRMDPDPTMSNDDFQSPWQIDDTGAPSGGNWANGILGWRVGSADCKV